MPRLPEIEVEQKPGETTRVQLHDGSWITLKALHHQEHDVTSRGSALQLLEQSREKHEFLTGLLYVDTRRDDFINDLKVADTPLARLPEERLRPGPEVLAKIMETI